jgi:peptidoglycan/LPS O-acetylase OafA/YrhL
VSNIDCSEPKKMSPSYYPMLDIWRGIAVLWVLLHHINIFFGLRLIFPSIIPLATKGFLGVDIFFVLSGFLIAGLLLPDFGKEIRWKRFYIRRFFKIAP